MKIFFLTIYNVFLIAMSRGFAPNRPNDLIFVYDKIDPAISFDEIGNQINHINFILSSQKQYIFKKFFNVFPTQSDVIVEEITYESDNSIFKSKMDAIKKEKRLESPMKALLKALKISSANSLIFVFTLAYPENSLLLPDILELIESKKIEVGFALDWNHFSEGIPEEYLNISYVGNGIIYDNILQVFDFMQHLIYDYKDFYKVNLLTINNNKSNNHKISIDYFLSREIITSFSKTYRTNGRSGIFYSRFSFSGKEIDTQIITPNTQTRDTPILDLRSTFTSHINFVRISGFSDFNSYFNFNYGFSTNRVMSMQETSSRPTLDIPNYIYIQPTTSISNPDVQHCEIIAPNGDVEYNIKLRRRNDSDFYYGLFEPSWTNHRYLRITAILYGKTVQRMSSNGISSANRKVNENESFCAKFEEYLIWYATVYGVILIAVGIITVRVALRKNETKGQIVAGSALGPLMSPSSQPQ